ncbi:MAG: hypothetical protein WEE89_16040 [Gemmatimonadota bacterium]
MCRPFVFLLVLAGLDGERAKAQRWTVGPKPVVTIGAVEGAPEYQFQRISHARRLSDGRILVVTGLDLRFYDAEGKYLSKAGGSGRGPGEFQYIGDLRVLRGDTLLLLSELGPVWLTGDGKYVRQEAIDYPKYTGDGWFTEQGAGFLLPDGQFLALQFAQQNPNEPRPAFYRPGLRYALFDKTAARLQPLFTSGAGRQLVRARPATGISQPFSPYAQQAIGSDRIYLGDNDTTFLRVFGFDGKPLGTVRVADKAVPVSPQDLALYRDNTLKRLGNNEQRKAEFERNWADVEKPRRHPYWGVALVDLSGNLWVSDHNGFRALRPVPTSRSVYDSNGQRVASATLPSGFQPKEIGTNYVLGVARDEFDVEYLQVYSLTKAGR